MKRSHAVLIAVTLRLIMLVLAAAFLYAALYGIGWLMWEYEEPVNFSERFVTGIRDDFGLLIPEEAELFSGEYSSAMAQDPYVEFTFSLDATAYEKLPRETEAAYFGRIAAMMTGGTYEPDGTGMNASLAEAAGESCGADFSLAYVRNEAEYTPSYLFCAEAEGKLWFHFVGWF